MGSISYRGLREEDAEGFRSLFNSIVKEGGRFPFETEFSVETAQKIIDGSRSGRRILLGAFIGDALIGWIEGSPDPRPNAAHSMNIAIGVLQQYRNQKIGEALVTKAIEKAVDLSYLWVRLEVLQKNPAINLYKRLGFKKTGELHDMYFIAGHYESSEYYALRLTPNSNLSEVSLSKKKEIKA